MNRYAHVTYCDDIRHEQGGKTTLVGVYAGTLLVASFPTVVPKLCVALAVSTPASQPFKVVKFRVLRDGEMIAEGEVPRANLPSAPTVTALGAGGAPASRCHTVMANVVFSPFETKAPGVIRVEVQTEAGTLHANDLVISQMPPPATRH